MKRIIGTALTVAVVLTLFVLGIVFGRAAMSAQQIETLKILLIVCVCSIAYCFIVGELAQNFSQMDKLWSILPIVYAWIVAVRNGIDLRTVVYALIVTVWGVRLTLNFARKGAYSLRFWTGEEDYRWSIVRSRPVFSHKFLWTLFDLLFISMYQNLLVLAITLPVLACMGSKAPFGAWDLVGAALAVGFLTLEAISDEYQWNFHQTKKKLQRDGGALESLPSPYDLGFNTRGPWSRMRHPNYLGEQGFWLSLYLFAVGAGAAKYGVFHWTIAGPLLLVLLFMGSSTLGESISFEKYPRYGDYIAQVHKYMPLNKFDPGK